MATKWPKGSAGEKEAKQNKVIAGFLIVVTILALLLEFVIPSELRDNVKAAPAWLNVLGGLITAGSAAPPIIGLTAAGDTKNHAKFWVILLALGFFTAAGFYGYTY